MTHSRDGGRAEQSLHYSCVWLRREMTVAIVTLQLCVAETRDDCSNCYITVVCG